ncbi:MAG: NFACT RNA binding domain-containing protein [Synechococcus sp.]|nr:NFACT RNA binding domain-containing protein [Synechococcus sp.]
MPRPMQPQDTTALQGVVQELSPLLIPSRFEKAQQPSPTAVQLGFRTLRQRVWLELHWQADGARFHAVPAPPRSGEGSTLAQQLQHGLSGLALVRLEQPPWERVIELGFAQRPGAPEQRRLVLELMGRHSNLFLLDERGVVVATGRQVREHQSRLRPIGTGDAYSPPPALQGAIPDPAEAQASWQKRLQLLPLPLGKALMDSYRGISPALRNQLLQTAELDGQELVSELEPREWQQLYGAWQQWLQALQAPLQFCAQGSGYRCWSPEAPSATSSGEPLAFNLALAHYYGEGQRRQQFQRRSQQLKQQLQQLINKEERERERQQQLLQRSEDEGLLQKQADLLLCRPDVNSSGHQQLRLADPEGGPDLELQLNPQLSLVTQAQKLYQRARKLRRSVAAIEPRLQLHRQRLELLENSRLQLELAEQGDAELLEALAEDLTPFLEARRSNHSQRRERERQGIPQPLELSSPDGLRLLVGRNHLQNDWISFRQARRGDLWFHAQEQPGSHVVLKGSEGLVGDSDLQAAADLAAHFSRSRGNRKVPVVMVPVEQLQRIPGMGPGLVRHGGGDVLWGEPDRAAALLPTLTR